MKKKIYIALAIAAAFIILSIAFWYQSALDRSVIEEQTAFSVENGQNVRQIATNLEEQGVIGSDTAFVLYTKNKGLASKLQAGDYFFKAGDTIRTIAKRLSLGEAVFDEKSILIKEGMTLAEIDAELKEKDLLSDCGEYFDLTVKELPDSLKDYDFWQHVPKDATIEGYVFPDTYRIYASDGCEALLKKAFANFQDKVSGDLLSEAVNGRGLHNNIIMASLLEEEVRSAEDMKIVSGVFWNRRQIGQPLQSCATLAYILGENKPQYTTADTQIKSPYNTYQNKGLPPGPVSNPGLQAIEAALNPTETDYNYFLSRPDTGETVFSRTYDEHLRNKARYLD